MIQQQETIELPLMVLIILCLYAFRIQTSSHSSMKKEYLKGQLVTMKVFLAESNEKRACFSGAL